MTIPTAQTLLIFLPADSPLDYGRRLGRLRWRRALGADGSLSPPVNEPARALFEGSAAAVVVADDHAIPAPLGNAAGLFVGRVVPALSVATQDVPVHTLRELEQSEFPAGQNAIAQGSRLTAVGFDPAVFPPFEGETLNRFGQRLFAHAASLPRDASFRALAFDHPPEHDREELIALLPSEAMDLCDVGCGSGSAGAAFARRVPGARVTGIESDPRAAARARERLDRVLESDARSALEGLCREGQTFDAFLFGDVLEHFDDPHSALRLARALARPEARLVASVPNAGHLSLVRDLIHGRFDYVPAGLADAGHLRWFDVRFFRETLEEAGWQVEEITEIPGAPPLGAEAFFSLFSEWPNLARDALLTYQWVAVARACRPLTLAPEATA